MQKSETILKKPNITNKTFNTNVPKSGAVDPNQIKPELKYRKKNDNKFSAFCHTHTRKAAEKNPKVFDGRWLKSLNFCCKFPINMIEINQIYAIPC